MRMMSQPQWLTDYARSEAGREQARQLGRSRRVHGHAGGVGSVGQSPTYQSWRAMKGRCLYPRHRDYARYGGRGISIDLRWLGHDGFSNFLADMGPRPAGTTLDRIDNDGNYGPDNSRWATPQAQRANRPTTRGWKQRADRRHGVYGTKTITCLRCGVGGTVSTVVSRWNCPDCRRINRREATARFRARVRSSLSS